MVAPRGGRINLVGRRRGVLLHVAPLRQVRDCHGALELSFPPGERSSVPAGARCRFDPRILHDEASDHGGRTGR